jgi:hypothetical protein
LPAVSECDVRDVLAGRDDDPAELVTQDQRPLAVSGSNRASPVVVLEVRAADTARRDLDDHILVAGGRLGNVFEAYVLDVVEDCCFHHFLTFRGRGDREDR